MAVLFSAVRLMAEQNKEVPDMNDWDRLHRQAQRYKETYPPGTRIMLLSMGNDPNPVESGTRGTVRAVDDIGTLHCDFDNGRTDRRRSPSVETCGFINMTDRAAMPLTSSKDSITKNTPKQFPICSAAATERFRYRRR